MARKPKDADTRKDGSLRIRPEVNDLLAALEDAIQRKSAGGFVSKSDIVFAALKLLAKEIAPELLPPVTGADLLAAAVAQAPTAPAQNSPAPRRAES